MWHLRVYLSRFYIDWIKNKARRLHTLTGPGNPRVGVVASALIRDAIDRQVDEKLVRRGQVKEGQ